MTSQVANGNGAATAAPSRHTEAPASATVKAIDPAGYEWLLTVRADSAGDMMTRVTFLSEWFARNEWRPAPTRPTLAPPATQGNGQATEAAPICPTHGKPMKQGKHGWYCPAKIADDDGTGRPAYCRQTVK